MGQWYRVDNNIVLHFNTKAFETINCLYSKVDTVLCLDEEENTEHFIGKTLKELYGNNFIS